MKKPSGGRAAAVSRRSALPCLRRAGCFLLAVFLLLALPLCAAPVRAAQLTDISQVVSDAWLVMDAQTGQLLAARNPDKTKYPASITKILTLALTLQYGDLDDRITVSQEAAQVDAGSTHIALQPGEVITVRDAAMATLLASANDAANCLAEYISGSNAAFADLMNQTVQSIGCTGTHFTNPSGLPDDDHYTTARDMARITAWALQVEGFRELFAADFYTMPATNLQPETRSWGTQNAMYVTSAFQYEGAWGGKLGWTEEAHHTMVTVLQREGRDLVLVTMDSTQKYQKYWDAICILDTCFDQLEPLALTAEQIGTASAPVYSGETLLGTAAFAPEGLCLWVPKGTDAQALQPDWQAPARLEVGDDSAAALTVTLPEAAACLPERTVSLTVPQSGLEEVQAAWRSLQAEEDGAAAWQTVRTQAAAARRWRIWRGVLLGLLALVGLAFGVRWYNLARRNLRRYGRLFRPRRPAFGRSAPPRR